MDLMAETEKEREELIFSRECHDKNLILRNRQSLSKHHACICMHVSASCHVTFCHKAFILKSTLTLQRLSLPLIAFDIDELKADFTKHTYI